MAALEALVVVGALPGERDLETILHQGEPKPIALAEQGQGCYVPGLGALHELRPVQVLGQLELIDAALDREVFPRLHRTISLLTGGGGPVSDAL